MMKRFFFILLLFAAHCPALYAQPYWRNEQMYRLNKVQPHADIVPLGGWSLSLCGEWSFGYGTDPSQKIPLSGRILVPGSIECQGFGAAVYGRGLDKNAVGVYSRSFSLPESWKGRRTIVKVEAAEGALLLYINGKEVGYSEDSKTPAEWDITRYLQEGENVISLKTIRWCSGSLFEHSERWLFSGLSRGVLLYSVPQTYISDLKIQASPVSAEGDAGRLSVLADLNREVSGGSVLFRLEKDGRVLLSKKKRIEKGDWYVDIAEQVSGVQFWNDSTPVLYSLHISLFSAEGRLLEEIKKQVGFREVCIEDGVLKVNGRRVVLRGVNHVEHSPLGGAYVSLQEMKEDIRLMKSMGVNAVRTVGGPHSEAWYDLCDSAGIYVWNEANVYLEPGQHLSDVKTHLNPILDRVYNLYKRDRNHPSVIVWSLGGASENGYCMEEAYRFLKGKDGSRPVVCISAAEGWNTDVVAMEMASLKQWVSSFPSRAGRRPCVAISFGNTLGNSLSRLQDDFSFLTSRPNMQGGFLEQWAERRMQGVDCEDCDNGIVSAQRVPHPTAAELSAVYGVPRAALSESEDRPMPPVAKMKRGYRRIVTSRQAEGCVVLSAAHAEMRISMQDGSIVSYRYKNRELLSSPLTFSFRRAPAGSGAVCEAQSLLWRQLEPVECSVLSVVENKMPEKSGLEVRLLMRICTASGLSLRVLQSVWMEGEGRVRLAYTVIPDGSVQTLQRLGIHFGVDTSFSVCSFYGNSFETYPDRCAARRFGLWHSSLSSLASPCYSSPQEFGNHEVLWLQLGADEQSLLVCPPSSQGNLSFTVRRKNSSAILSAKNWSDVTDDSFYRVNVDFMQSPIGEDHRFDIKADSSYHFAFLLVPGGLPLVAFPPHPDESISSSSVSEQKKLSIASVWLSSSTAADDIALLHDGLLATAGDYRRLWLSFSEADTLEFSLRLSRFADVGSISIGCCHSPADEVLKPQDVQVCWSIDGVHWSQWESMEMQNPPADIFADSKRVVYRTYPKKARAVSFFRIRLVCHSLLPIWHPSAGTPARTMLDEVEILER